MIANGSGLLVRGWRIGRVEPDGLSCYFDPLLERVEIHALTDEEKQVRLDMVGSVSGLDSDSDPCEIVQLKLFPEGTRHGS